MTETSETPKMIPLNPTPFIKQLIKKDIVVKLKWGMEYIGTLTCADAYMNLQLANAVEFIEGESQGVLPELLIRCNNILYIREKQKESTNNN